MSNSIISGRLSAKMGLNNSLKEPDFSRKTLDNHHWHLFKELSEEKGKRQILYFGSII